MRWSITDNDESTFRKRRHGLKIMEVRPDLAELDNYVRTNRWYALGLQLGIEDKELEAIKIKCGGDIDECRRDMFHIYTY